MKKTNKTKNLKLWDKIEMDWLDSIHNTDGWSNMDNFGWDRHYRALYHKAIGYYLKSTKDAITICQARAIDNAEGFIQAFTIPLGAITKIRRFK